MGGDFGVMGRTDRLAQAIADFRFDPDDLGWLRSAGVVSDTALGYLASYHFGGSVHGYPEGEVWFPDMYPRLRYGDGSSEVID